MIEIELIKHDSMLKRLQEADERIRIMLDANPQVNILFDSNFNVVDCNPAALHFMRFKTKEEMIAGFMKRISESIPAVQPGGRPSIPIADRFKTATKEGSVKFETEIILCDETHYLIVEFKKIPYKGSFGIVAYVIDMTDIREREKQLALAREQNELQLTKLNMAVKATKIGLWDMEINNDDPVNPNNTLMWSDEFRHMLGYSNETEFPNELNSWSSRLHPDDKERVLKRLKKHLLDKTGKTPYDIEYRLLKKSGEYAYFRDSGESIRDANGNVVHIVGTLMDITETKSILLDTEKKRIEAEAANKAKSAFLSTMSHEIRTPMNAILGIAEIQLQNEMLDKNIREAFDKIYVSGDLLLGIINDILDLSKIEAGKLELIIGNYETASLISDTAQLNMMRVGSKPIEFELWIDENLPATLSGDELRIKQVLNNLLSNAFKYTMAGKVELLISTEADSENDDNVTLVMAISDTGRGMTQDQINRLFDEYSRFNQEANRETEGTGLGMSITRNLIRLMNGEIFVNSKPDKGTTFTVRLPQVKVGSQVLGSELAENLHRFRTSSRSQMKRVQITREPMPYGSVLIVDDVETNIYVARGLLAPYELSIDTADSGFAAIEKIKNGNMYDIVFMDHMMPGMDGIEATRVIRSMGYERSIVALTANAVSGQADIFLENGFDDYISKPIDVRQMNSVLNKLIRDKQPPDVVKAARFQKNAKDEQISERTPQSGIDPQFAEVFVRDASKSIVVLEAIYERGTYGDDDMRMYVIHMHGMKSALANIRKMELSSVALKLEMSGRDGDKEVITSETRAFLTSLRALIEELSPKEETVGDETVDEDLPYLLEKLTAIKAACEEYDEKTVDNITAELRLKTWSQQTKELLCFINEHILHSDFDEITCAVEKFVNNYTSN